MPSYFHNLQDAEISGGDFASIGGDFVGVDGVRQASGPRDKSEPISYFANGKGLKITGGNFMAVGGNFFHHGGARSPPPTPQPPQPPQFNPQYGGYTAPHPSTTRQTFHTQSAPPFPSAPSPPSAPPPSMPPQQASYNYQGGGYREQASSQGYHAPYPSQPVAPYPPPPLADTSFVRPSLLYSQSGPTGAPHLTANLSASVELRHTNTEPIAPSHTENVTRSAPSGLDIPNHRPLNLNPSIDIWAERPGERDAEAAGSDSDSDDENRRKKKKGKGKLSKQFKKVFTRTSE